MLSKPPGAMRPGLFGLLTLLICLLGFCSPSHAGVFVYDTFTGPSGDITAHTGEMGATWSKVKTDGSMPSNLLLSGTGTINTNFAGGDNVSYYATGTPAASNAYTLEAVGMRPCILVRGNGGTYVTASRDGSNYFFGGSGPQSAYQTVASGTSGVADNAPCALKAVVTAGGGGSVNIAYYVAPVGGNYTLVASTTDNTVSAPVKVGLWSIANEQMTSIIAYDNGTPLYSAIPSITQVTHQAVYGNIGDALAANGPVTYQWQRALASSSTFADVGSAGQTLSDTTVTQGTSYKYRVKQTDNSGPNYSAEVVVNVPNPPSVYEDSFAGTANQFLIEHVPTTISGNSPIVGSRWRSLLSSVAYLNGSGGVVFDANTSAAYHIAITAKAGYPDAIFEARTANWSVSSITVGLHGNKDSGDGYLVSIGRLGFNNNSAFLIINGVTVATLGAPDDTSLDYLNGGPVSVRMTVTGSASGIRHLKVQVSGSSTNPAPGGSYTTLFDTDLNAAQSATAPGYPVLAASGSAVDYVKVTYYPDTTPTSGTPAKMVVVGDSNSQFLSAALGRIPVSAAVGKKLFTLDSISTEVFNVAQAGVTTNDYANQPANKLLALASKVVQVESAKVAIILLGTNDTGRTKAQYKADMLTIITALKTAGIQRIVLYTPAGSSDSTNSTLYGQFDTALSELVTADPTTLTKSNDLLTYFLANAGSSYLPDGLHYSLGTLGAPAARDIIYNALRPVMLSAYSQRLFRRAANTQSGRSGTRTSQ